MWINRYKLFVVLVWNWLLRILWFRCFKWFRVSDFIMWWVGNIRCCGWLENVYWIVLFINLWNGCLVIDDYILMKKLGISWLIFRLGLIWYCLRLVIFVLFSILLLIKKLLLYFVLGCLNILYVVLVMMVGVCDNLIVVLFFRWFCIVVVVIVVLG